MPSAALMKWQNERRPSLAHVDAQCAASVAAVPANVALIDENYRGYVLLLAAHFQGFCRDFHTERCRSSRPRCGHSWRFSSNRSSLHSANWTVATPI